MSVISSFAQCWKAIDIKGDTNRVILAIRDDHTLWDFTNDTNGIQVGTQAIFEKCFSSGTANFAIALDSTLWGWTNSLYGNFHGELGIGNTNPQPNIIQLNYSKWISVSSSYGITSGIKADGTIWFWGQETNINNILYPIQIGSDNDWQNVKANWNTVYALKNDGTIWKRNVNPISSPFFQIGTDSDWSSIWVEYSTPFGIKNNGTLWYNTWNSNGVQVGNDTNWESISESAYEKYAIKTDGTLWFWDWNVNPLLVPPVQITTFSDYSQISQNLKDSNGVIWTETYAIHDSNQLWIEKYNMDAPCPATTAGLEHPNNKVNLTVIIPNPATDNFTITGMEKLDSTTSMKLKDMNGKVVKVLDSNATNFNITDLKAGMYFLEISTGKTYEVVKLVKE